MRQEDRGPLITAQNVSFGYDGHIAVNSLSFTVDRGDYLCVAGENGSGKTTLARGILRLLDPLDGEIHFAPDLQRTKTGFLSQQNAAKRDFPAGVREIVRSGMAGGMGLRPFYSRAEKEKALENMRRLGVSDLQNRCFRELSGGQQRRVLIARALCAAGTLLVLDEPTAGLDPLVTTELYALLQKLNRETGLTIIMVSHDIRAAVQYAGCILHIKKEGAFFGKTPEYIQSEFGREFLQKEGDNHD